MLNYILKLAGNIYNCLIILYLLDSMWLNNSFPFYIRFEIKLYVLKVMLFLHKFFIYFFLCFFFSFSMSRICFFFLFSFNYKKVVKNMVLLEFFMSYWRPPSSIYPPKKREYTIKADQKKRRTIYRVAKNSSKVRKFSWGPLASIYV